MALIDCPVPDPDLFWNPITSPQATAIHSLAEILMFGGAAGSAKTSFLIADAVQEYDNPRMRSLFLRESFPQIEQNILPRMRELYSQMGAYYVGGSKRIWTFASGAAVRVGFYGEDSDFENYQGGEYSGIYFDESTHHPESHIRKLLPWWRTTDPSLFRRMRLATNPGNVGAAWHQHVFLRNKCPYHNPWDPKNPRSKDNCVEPGGIYKGATWLSDKKPIPYTVSFIPGLHSDHGLLGEDYADTLRTQEAAIADKLLLGCWCSLEGAYFPFLDQSYLKPYAAAQEKHWEAHWISIDYGYGGKEGEGSWAAAGLYVVKESGQKFKIGSMVEPQMGAKEFVQMVITNFVTERRIGEQFRNCYFAGVLLDPATDEHKDTGQSIFEMMRDEFAKHNIPSYKASKASISNAQALLNSLKTKNLVICDTARATYDSLRTRMHDPKRPGAIKKIKGDPLDDVADETCLAKGTLVRTINGNVPIELISVGDLVATRRGWKPVTWSGMTGRSLEAMTLECSNGNSVTGTREHRIYTKNRGFVRLDEITYHDTLLSWDELNWSSSTESSFADTQTPKAIPPDATLPPEWQTSGAASICSTVKSGSSIGVRSRRDTTSITSTKIPDTTTSRISSAFIPTSMPPVTQRIGGCTIKRTTSFLRRFAQRLRSGMELKKASGGTANIERDFGRNRTHTEPSPACAARKRLRSDALMDRPNTVAETAARSIGGGAGLMTLTLPAQPAGRSFERTSTCEESTAPVSALALRSAERCEVYDISVAGDAEFFANGILVHNSYLNAYIDPSIKPRDVEIQEKVDEMRELGLDENSLAINAWRLTYEQKRSEEPMVLGRRHGPRVIKR